MPKKAPIQEHRPRDETRQLLVDLLRQSDQPLSRTQIARALNRRKSLHLNSLIDALVLEGLVARTVATFPTRVQGYVYYWVQSEA